MATPPMLLDIARTLLALAAPAALLCLVLAGIALRRDGGRNSSIGGGFSRWMFWAVVFLTLPQLMACRPWVHFAGCAAGFLTVVRRSSRAQDSQEGGSRIPWRR